MYAAGVVAGALVLLVCVSMSLGQAMMPQPTNQYDAMIALSQQTTVRFVIALLVCGVGITACWWSYLKYKAVMAANGQTTNDTYARRLEADLERERLKREKAEANLQKAAFALGYAQGSSDAQHTLAQPPVTATSMQSYSTAITTRPRVVLDSERYK